MEKIVLYLVMTFATGGARPLNGQRIELLLTDPRLQCSYAGVVTGVTVDRFENPGVVIFPAPRDVTRHCRVPVGDLVAQLPFGEFHFATTLEEIGEPWMVPHNPHVSPTWVRMPQVGPRVPTRVTNFRIVAP